MSTGGTTSKERAQAQSRQALREIEGFFLTPKGKCENEKTIFCYPTKSILKGREKIIFQKVLKPFAENTKEFPI